MSCSTLIITLQNVKEHRQARDKRPEISVNICTTREVSNNIKLFSPLSRWFCRVITSLYYFLMADLLWLFWWQNFSTSTVSYPTVVIFLVFINPWNTLHFATIWLNWPLTLSVNPGLGEPSPHFGIDRRHMQASLNICFLLHIFNVWLYNWNCEWK